MRTLWQDLRYGARMLLKNPGLTAVASLSLALGIGANTAIFSVINTVLLKSLPYSEPDRVALVWGNLPAENKHRSQVSATDVDDWRHQNMVFEDVTTYASWSATLLNSGEPERIQGMQVGDGYFSIMRGTPLLGRVFLSEEQEDGKDMVIVLGYGLWQRRFGGDPDIVGRKVNLGGKPYTIVGVMPADFRSLPSSLVGIPGQFYRPVAEPHDEGARSARHLRSIARLKPGATLGQAQSEMNVIASRLEQEHATSNKGYGVRLVTLPEDTVGGLRPTLLTLFGAVVFVLLIACANVGNLLLARATARQKEIAIRAALGAGRVRLVRQLLTESVLLALLGGAMGLLLALWAVSLIETLGSHVMPSFSGIKVDPRVLGFTAVISMLTSVIFGLAPALHGSKPDLNETLKDGGRSSGASASSNRLRGTLVVSEMALALVLLICAGLLIRSVMRLHDVDPGFNQSHLLTMNVPLPESRYPKRDSWIAFYRQAVNRIETLPGVQAAGFTSVLPFSDNFDGRSLAVEDHPVPRGEEISVDLYVITPAYLQTMSIPLREGRAVTEQDTENATLVALINETMAGELWPHESPLGKRIKFPGFEENAQPWRTIVGVMSNVKQYGLDKEARMQIYLPEAQYPNSGMTLVVRTKVDPSNLIASVRSEIHAVDQELAVDSIATMEQLLADSISLQRFSLLLLMIFAGIALALAGVGIYGVISFTVTQRTREIGVRMALGAASSDILKLVVRQSIGLSLIGIGIGLCASLGLTRLLAALLFGVSPTDPVTFTVISLLLMGVALAASFIPARRAMRVDPMNALRCE
jgi:putative ABC transport system permease protein